MAIRVPWIPVLARTVQSGHSLINRFGRPQEMAEAVLWLSSPPAPFTFGLVLAVDAGFLSR